MGVYVIAGLDVVAWPPAGTTAVCRNKVSSNKHCHTSLCGFAYPTSPPDQPCRRSLWNGQIQLAQRGWVIPSLIVFCTHFSRLFIASSYLWSTVRVSLFNEGGFGAPFRVRAVGGTSGGLGVACPWVHCRTPPTRATHYRSPCSTLADS